MFQYFRLILYVARELIFDSKEESDYRSSKFSVRKFAIFLTLMLSFAPNHWLFYRLYVTYTKHRAHQEHLMQACKEQEFEKICLKKDLSPGHKLDTNTKDAA